MSILRRFFATALWSGVVVPPVASLVLLATVLMPESRAWADPVYAVPSFLALFFIFAVPVGYVFGSIPALLAGAIYSGVLNATGTTAPRPLLRAGLGALCGGVTGAIWFHATAGAGWLSYATAAALTMALFARCSPAAPAPTMMIGEFAAARLAQRG